MQGLQTFTENGEILIDITSRIQKYLGAFTCPANQMSGIVEDSRLQEGDLWYLIVPTSYPELRLAGNNEYKYSVPTITKEWGRLRWSFTMSHVECRVLYGVY